MLLKAYQILGTDKPILKERELHHYYLDEIVHLNEDPENYEVVAYVQMDKYTHETFFQAVYSKKG